MRFVGRRGATRSAAWSGGASDRPPRLGWNFAPGEAMLRRVTSRPFTCLRGDSMVRVDGHSGRPDGLLRPLATEHPTEHVLKLRLGRGIVGRDDGAPDDEAVGAVQQCASRADHVRNRAVNIRQLRPKRYAVIGTPSPSATRSAADAHAAPLAPTSSTKLHPYRSIVEISLPPRVTAGRGARVPHGAKARSTTR